MLTAEQMRVYDAKRSEQRKASDRASHLRRRGITQERYDAVLARQGGVCGMCGTSEPGWSHKHFVIDHDHECCGVVMKCGECFRGLLCMSCNIGLGHYEKFKLQAETYLVERAYK